MANGGARVILLAGPSGSGKSRLALRLGLPVLRLDDFYRDGDDPALPRIERGANAGLADWDDPRSWQPDDALACLAELCRTGSAEVPVYEIARDGRTGTQRLDLAGSTHLVAEGIFAQEVVEACAAEGLLDSAWCIRQHPAVTFTRRLARDLTERRKPPLVLLRRGLALARAQRRVVAHAVALGCRPATGDEAYAAIRARIARPPRTGAWPVPAGWRQPDDRTCGPTVLVVARMLASPTYAASLTSPADFSTAVLDMHHRTNRTVGPAQSLQAPWPRALGTPPWAAAAELSALTPAASYRTRLVRFGRAAFRLAVDALHAGRPVAVYVGSATLPRHVVLLTGVQGGRVELYDPADGARHQVPEPDVAAGRLPRLSGWSVPWFVVAPGT